jgi:hypothetical protein
LITRRLRENHYFNFSSFFSPLVFFPRIFFDSFQRCGPLFSVGWRPLLPSLPATALVFVLSLGWVSLLIASPTMAPTNRKRASSSVPPRSDPKRRMTATVGKGGGNKTPSKKQTATQTLSTLGFSSSKRQKYQIGAKMLLGDNIYDGVVPLEVQNHMFVYEITQIDDSAKTVTVEYKNQVIRKGGDKFRVYKDSDEKQVGDYVLIVCLRFISNFLTLFFILSFQ